MANKLFATMVAPDGTKLPIQYADLLGDASLWGLIHGSIILGPNGLPITSANPFQVNNATLAFGEDPVNNRLVVVGVDAAGNANKWAINAAGQLAVLTEGQRATYSVAIFGHAPAATPTDFLTILGSATKTTRLLRLWIAGRATAAAWYRVRLLKYSTAYAAGTAAAQTLVPHDSADGGATSVVNTWAGGLPTVGTLVGALHDDDVPLNAAALTATQPFVGPAGVLWDFTTRNGKGIVLRGTTQYVALNGAGVALPAGTVFDMKAELSEE